MFSVLLLLAQAQNPDLVVEGKKKDRVCVVRPSTGSRLRTERRCTTRAEAKIEELEAKRTIDATLQQARLQEGICAADRSKPGC